MEIGKKRGLEIGVLQLITIWPFPDKQIFEVVNKIENIFVVEMNMGQIINEVKRASIGKGRIRGINKYDGTLITPDEILEQVLDKPRPCVPEWGKG